MLTILEEEEGYNETLNGGTVKERG
jgi:hypothetical protein